MHDCNDDRTSELAKVARKATEFFPFGGLQKAVETVTWCLWCLLLQSWCVCQSLRPDQPLAADWLRLKSRWWQERRRHSCLQCESKKSPLRLSDFFFHFSTNGIIFNWFFTHLLYVPMYAGLQIFIQISPSLTKLCHIKRDYLVHICAKCPKRTKTRAFRRLRRSLIAFVDRYLWQVTIK